MTYIPTINTARIAADAVTAAKIAADAVGASEIAADAVGASEIATDAVGSAELANDAVDTAAIANGAVTGAKIAADTITAANLAADSVTSSELADNAVDTNAIADDAVTAAKIAADAVGSSEIAANAVGSSELADNAVDTNAIQDDAVTAAKIGAGLDAIAAATAATGDITASSQKITNLADGTNANDAVNYGQLTAVANGIVDWKNSVRVVTAGALAAYTRTGNVITADANGALAAIDGVTLVANDRLLLKDGAAGADNGIYVVTQVGSAGTPFILTRASDADASAEVTSGMAVSVTEGSTYDNTLWLLATNDPITLNTTSLSFIQLPSLQDLIAGAGLTKSGNTIDVGAGTGVTVNANDVAIDTSVVPQLAADNVFTGNTTLAGLNFATTTKTANYTVDLDVDHTILADSTGGAFTVTLPASHTSGDTVVVKDAGGAAGTNAVLIATADADTIDGAADYSIANNYESIELRSNGTNWFIV